MNILIVDDEPTSRALLRQMLATDETMQITEAVDGESAWALLDDPMLYFDVIFLDVQMAPVNGLEVLARIRKSSMLSSVPVVLCTAANDRETVVQAIQLGIKHYLVKPPAKEAVMQKLEQIRLQLAQHPSQRRNPVR